MNPIDPPWTTLVDVATLAAALGEGIRVVDARATASTAVRVVDARSSLADPQAGSGHYLAGHIPGAVYADLNRDLSDLSRVGHGRHPLPDSDAFAAKLGQWGIGPDTQVVVYDGSDGSMAASRLWWLLRLIGHSKVAVLDGGIAAWQAAGQPLATGPDEVTALPAYPGRFDTAQIANAEEISARLKHAPGWLVDARAGERFRGEVEPLDPVAGHIPGALNRPYTLNLGADGRFKPRQQLRAEFDALLAGRDAAGVAHHCGSGVSAVPNVLAMELAGYPPAALYGGSWSEWSRTPGLPMAQG